MKRNFIIVILVLIIAVIFAFFNYQNKNSENQFKNDSYDYSLDDLNNLNNLNNFLPSAKKHIFLGTINKEGKAEGFHYANIKNSSSHIILDTKTKNNKFGVFMAKAIIDGKAKSDDEGYSTFFPDSYSPQKVINAINEAYKNRKHLFGNVYEGTSSSGMKIELYLSTDNKIISAFPKY